MPRLCSLLEPSIGYSLQLVARIISAPRNRTDRWAGSPPRKACRGLSRCPHPPDLSAQLWLAKTVIMSYQLLLATVVLVGAALVSGMITKAGPVPWRKLLLGGMLLWVTSLPLIPIQLWAAEMLGFIGSMAVGTVGFAAGVWAAPAPHWIYYPWSWPIRMMCPLIGVHPNGTFLPPNDPLLNSGVIPLGLTLAVLVTIAFCLGGAFWFSRQEVLS